MAKPSGVRVAFLKHIGDLCRHVMVTHRCITSLTCIITGFSETQHVFDVTIRLVVQCPLASVGQDQTYFYEEVCADLIL